MKKEEKKTIFFYTVWDFSNEKADGIVKKIKSQIQAFTENGYRVTYSYIKNNKTYIQTQNELLCLGKIGIARKFLANYYISKNINTIQFDSVYIRYGFVDYFFIKALKKIKNKSNKIVLEIPTYPYDNELKANKLYRVVLAVDKIFRLQMHKYVDKIVTYSEDEMIYKIPTIRTTNGIDIKSVKKRDLSVKKEGIQIIGVASLAAWHGFDRLIEGIKEYYHSGGKEKIVFHLVGDGPPYKDYVNMVKKYSLEKHVILYGFLSGEDLDRIYDKCNMAVECLALHRKGLKKASSLKGIEYGAKGLPVITYTNIEVYPYNKYQFIVSHDDTPIDMEKVVQFYFDMEEEMEIAEQIYEEVKKYGDMSYTMRDIFEYIG